MIMIHTSRFIAAAAALAWSVMAPAAAACIQPDYSPKALRLGQNGISVIGFLVRADGTVAKSVVLSSSGSPELDQKTADALSVCEFKPAIHDGRPVEGWQPVAYTWTLEDDPDFARAIHAAAVAASKGDLAARLQLSLLLRRTANTEAKHERAETVLRSAADLGLAQAQFSLGRQLEQGLDGQPKDLEAAMAWYRKAAAQGDVLAVQRLEKGFLP
jgi:TonB family protein